MERVIDALMLAPSEGFTEARVSSSPVKRSVRKCDLLTLAFLIVLACCLAEVFQTSDIISDYREALPPMIFATWSVGFVLAVLTPPVCSVFCWHVATRSRHDCIVHLLFLPMMYAALQAAALLMLFASGESHLDLLSGYALVPATLLMMVCPMIHFGALVSRWINGRQRLATGS